MWKAAVQCRFRDKTLFEFCVFALVIVCLVFLIVCFQSLQVFFLSKQEVFSSGAALLFGDPLVFLKEEEE